MNEPELALLSGKDFAELSQRLTPILQSLPEDMRSRLRSIFRHYFSCLGPEGAYEQMNNRTVSQIFSEYQPIDSGLIVTGELDGHRYELHKASDDKKDSD